MTLFAHHLHCADTDPCPCCGEITRHVRGQFYRDGRVGGDYAARWTPARPDHGLLMLVSFADDDETGRRAAVLNWWFTDTGPGCGVVDPVPDHWPELVDPLGPFASRQAAIGGPWRETLFHFADHVVFEDPFVHAFLYGPPSRPSDDPV